MKPTAGDTENGIPRSHSATTPPVSASGAALNTSKASRAEPSAQALAWGDGLDRQTGSLPVAYRCLEGRSETRG